MIHERADQSPLRGLPLDAAPKSIPTLQASALLARRRRNAESGAVFGAQIVIGFVLLAGMYGLNAVGGNLVMPNPNDIVGESIKMWSDGTMIAGLGQSLTVISLGFLLSATTGIFLACCWAVFVFWAACSIRSSMP